MAKLLFLLLILFPLSSSAIEIRGSLRDRNALLTFLAGVTADPGNALASWGSSDPDACNWTGVRCHPIKHSVVQLDLSGRDLSGVVSPSLSNLSSLAVLDLSSNSFVGQIPIELGALSRLKQLSLASNFLRGSIPVRFGCLTELVYLDLGGNQLTGPIPETLFCNSTSLQYVDLSNNSLAGKIAYGNQCGLRDLRFLLLWSNNLEGPIPRALSNSSKLEWIDVESNDLVGELPSEVFNKLSYLQFLHLSYNNLSSIDASADFYTFFDLLRNCTYLQELELAGNNLKREIPSSVGSLSASLLQLHLEDNLLYGPIPTNLSNLANLTYLNLSNNFLNGSIPHNISKLRRLERFYLSNNLLSGEIPHSLGQISRLGLVDLSGNNLSGPIPNTLSNLSQLRRLMLHNNELSGLIPLSLGDCTNLEILDLSHNRLTGRIPGNVAGLRSLKLYLNLSNNGLSGPLPMELSKMDMVIAMDLSSNNFSGPIPSQLGSCIALEYLNLSSNSLQGLLPNSIGALTFLQSLDLSSNKLDGAMPMSLQASLSLKQLNLSFNNFSGIIPNDGVFALLSDNSFLGNPNLCGEIKGVPSCTRKHAHHFVILPIVLTLLGSSFFTACFFCYPKIVRSRGRKSRSLVYQDSMNDDDEQSKRDYPRISYNELVEATHNFSESNHIGSGRFGKVYKGILSDEMRIAVKVLNLKIGEREISGSFKRECDVLKRTRHRNLIKIITTCSRPDFKALVLPLMPNGNLDSHLYPSDGSSCGLSLVQLVSIASDVAEGIAYLHHHAPVKVVHCDLKPSNVLLDGDMKAVVSDFGIARLVKDRGDDKRSGDVTDVSASCISTTGLLHGSVGYIAPEYGLGGRPSTQGDVYSFGVLLLEIATGKRPTDVIFHEGLTLQEWVKSHYPHNAESLISHIHSIECSKDEFEGDVIMGMIELGLVCTHFAPTMRPTMVDVAHEMALLKLDLLRHGLPSSLKNSL